jgi:hypothetical protein
VVDVHQLSIFSKILPYVAMALLLSLPLAGLTADFKPAAYEDAIPEVSLMGNDGGATEDYLLRSEPELSFNVDLVPAEEPSFRGGMLPPAVKPALAVLSLKDLISEIFIPPEIVF